MAAMDWVKVFHHNTSTGLFLNAEDAQLNNWSNSGSAQFSVLSQLESFRWADGTLHLKLCYPQQANGTWDACNEWTQTSSPLTDSTIENFRSVSLAFPQEFQGLMKSSVEGELISGTESEKTFIIGAFGSLDISTSSIKEDMTVVELYAGNSCLLTSLSGLVGCQKLSTKGSDYQGSASTTRSGKTCQNWSTMSPHKHNFAHVGSHKKCRNPDGQVSVWCYTTNKEQRWEHCDVPFCVEEGEQTLLQFQHPPTKGWRCSSVRLRSMSWYREDSSSPSVL